MQSPKQVIGKFIPGISKSILKMEFYPFLYFLCVFINLLHVLQSITYQINAFNQLFKWFDLTNYIDHKILIYLFVGPLVILTVLILYILWGFKNNQRNQKSQEVFEHYIIKITATTSFVLSYACCILLIRCSISMSTSSMLQERIVAIINIILFLGIVYPYSMFFLTDLSPQNNKIFACIMFPNCFTYLNIYRPIAAIMIATDCKNYLPIPSTLILVALMISLLRFPLLTWRFNRISQMLMSIIIWSIIYSFMDLALMQTLSVVLYFVGIPIFALFMDWVLSRRIISIVKQNKGSISKLKILYYMLINKKDNEDELSIFILNHHRNCMNINCNCQSIFNHIHNFKILQQNNKKIKNIKSQQNTQNPNLNSKYNQEIKSQQTKNYQKSHKNQINKQKQEKQQNILWYKFLYLLYNDQINFEQLNKQSLPEKKSHFQQKKQLILDKVQILTVLELQYQSLSQFWSFQQMQKGQGFFSLFFFVRMFIQSYRQQKILKEKALQHQNCIYLFNYQLQKKIIKFRQIIYKATTKAISFWTQLYTLKPDNKKLTKALQQLLNIRKQIIKQKRKALKQTKKQNKRQKQDQQIIFEKQIKKAMNTAITPFEQAMRLNFKQNIQPNLQIIQQKNIQQNSYFQKNLPFTSKIQPAGIAVINLKQGSSFGQIKMANKYFWQFLNCQRYQNPYINHFLPPQIREYHSKRMVSFLEQNKQSLYLQQVYLVDPQNKLIQLQLFVQILPSIQNGFQFLAFIKAFKSVDSLFLVNNDANIIAYNKNFKQKILPNINIKVLRQFLSDDKIRTFGDQPHKQILTQDQKYVIKCINYKMSRNLLQPLYYCQIAPNLQQKSKSQQDIKQQINVIIEYQNQKQNQNYNQNQNKFQTQKQQQFKKSSPFQKNKNLPKQEKQQLESFNSKIRYLSIQKKNVITSRWKIFTIIMLLIIFILSMLAAYMIDEKIVQYLSAFVIYDNLTNFIQNIAQCTYMTRKINVISFNNQTTHQNIEFYYNQLKINQQKLREQIISINLKWWDASYQVFDLTPDGKLISGLTTFQMILQKFILAALTTYLEKSNWNYDYALSQQVIPYNDSLISLMSILRNSYYIILPKASVQFRDIINKSQYKILVLPIPQTPCMSSLLLTAVIIVITTICVRIKIVKASQHKFLIFQQLDASFIRQRLQTLKLYQTICLADLKMSKDSQKGRVQNNNLSQKNGKLYKEKMDDSIIRTQLSHIDAGESSVRDFGENSKIYDSQLLKNQNKRTDKDKLRISQIVIDKKIIIFKIIIGILPILLISSISLYLQYHFTQQFWKCLILKDLYHQKSQTIKFINTYSYQMGYEIDDFRSQSYSINNQLQTIYQNLYQILIKIDEYQQIQSQTYLNNLRTITKTKFCELLQEILAVKQGTKTCNSQDKALYQQKYMQQIIVWYIQASRNLKIKYKNTNRTLQKQRQFNNQTILQTIERLNIYLLTINHHITQIYNTQFYNRINIYKIVMLLLSLIMIPFTIIALVFWLRYNMQQMQFTIDKIKIIMQLISMKEIKGNLKLRNYLFGQNNILGVLD